MVSSSFDHDTTFYDVMDQFKSQAEGKTFVITGPSAGSIGAAAARGLVLGSPRRIILLGRSQSKIQPVIDELNTRNKSVDTHYVQIDLADNQSVYKAVQVIKSLTDEVHGLINCAGIMAPAIYHTSKDGIEIQFASNHIGHFLLTNLLIPEIKKGNGVVTNVSSGGYQVADPDFEDVNFNDGKAYNPWVAYGRSKGANILFSVALAKRFLHSDCAAFSVNPGYVEGTPLQKNSSLTPEDMVAGFNIAIGRGVAAKEISPRTVEQGAATIVLSVLDENLRQYSGAYLEYCQLGKAQEYVMNVETAEALWSLSESLVGEKFQD
ncbi:putative short-chain dehydrogenase [Trichoderma sp. SZMC 28014]